MAAIECLYFDVYGSTLKSEEKDIRIVAQMFATSELIEWGNKEIRRVFTSLDVKLKEGRKVLWCLAPLPTDNPIAFATMVGENYLMVFDIEWWEKMSPEQRHHIFLHELAHIINFVQEGEINHRIRRLSSYFDFTKGHHKKWKKTMRDLNQTPSRFVPFKLEKSSRSCDSARLVSVSKNEGKYYLNFSVMSRANVYGRATAALFFILVGWFALIGLALKLAQLS